MRVRALATALLALVLLAGCSGPDDPPSQSATTGPTATTTGAGQAGNATTPPAQPAYDLQECDQWHAFFPFPKSAFEEGGLVGDPLPEGFTLGAADAAGATVNVFVDTGRCGDQAQSATFAAYLVVQPPAELDQGPDDLDLYPLESATDDDALRAYLAAANVTWTDAAFAFTASPAPPGTRLETVAVDTNDIDFNLDFAVQEAAGAFDMTYAVWHKGADGRADGHVEWDNSNATNVGDGQAVFAAANADGGPPALPGLLHRVSTTDVRIRWMPVDPSPE
jgi:hypothetical protein